MEKRSQLNVRTDLLSEMLIETLMKETGMKKSELVRKMIFAYASDVLSVEEMEQLMSLAVTLERS